MITHQCCDPIIWPEVAAALAERPRPGITIHPYTHTPAGICIETADRTNTELVRKLIRAVSAHHRRAKALERHHLKKQLISRRPTPCRNKQS